MNWHLIQHNKMKGQFNMDYDIELARSCSANNAYFRLYRWKPYCISLGANQSFDDIKLDNTKKDGLEIVKRPTGGRAILHAEELTYSVVIPTSAGYTPKEVYEKISIALLNGLSLYHPKLKGLCLENEQPNFPKLLSEPSGKLCFGSAAKNEIKYLGKKVVGSAQRKLSNVLLQHGSILCGNYHRKLVDYIHSDSDIRLDLSESTTELDFIIGETINYTELQNSLIAGFEKVWNIKFPEINSESVESISIDKENF